MMGENESRLKHKDSQFPLSRQVTSLKLSHGESLVLLQGARAKAEALLASEPKPGM